MELLRIELIKSLAQKIQVDSEKIILEEIEVTELEEIKLDVELEAA